MTLTTASNVPATGQPTSGAWIARYRLLLGVIVCAHLPLVFLHLRHLWGHPHYQFFPFLLVAVGLLLWHRWLDDQAAKLAAPLSERWLLLSGLVLLASAVAVFSPWLGFVAAILTTAGVLTYFAGHAFWTHLGSVWVLLWVLVPPPFGLDLRLIEWLQTFTSLAASFVLDQCGVLHLLAGNIIELPGHQLFVEEACSGIQSVFALMSCVALFVVWSRRHVATALLLVASAVFWAGLFNIVRVATVALALAWWEYDLSMGWQHELLGIVIFAMALAMVLSTDRLLCILSSAWGLVSWRVQRRQKRRKFRGRRHRRRDSIGHDASPAAAPNRKKNASTRTQAATALWRSPIVIGVFGCLMVLQILILVVPQDSTIRLSKATASLDRSVLPEQQDEWKLVDYTTEKRELRSEFGQHSKVWSYRSSFGSTVVSFDYPFEGWHEVTRCYRSQGWNVLNRTVNGGQPAVESGAPSYVEVELSKPTGEYGYLLFNLFDDDGRPVRSPPSAISIWSKLYYRISRSPLFQLLRKSSLAAADSDAVTYQVQVLVSTDFRLSPVQRNEARSQFMNFNSIFRDYWGNTREDLP